MNNNIKSFTVIASIIASTSCYAQKNPDSQYFRHLMFRESPYAQYKGIHPITKDIAKSVAHYKFDYNEDGKVKAIAHQIGDEIINNNDNWDTFIWFSPKVTIEYSKEGETHRYFNADDEQVEAHGKVYTAKYLYNDKGIRASLTFYDKDNKPSENGWHANRYEWSVDNEQRVIEKRFSLNNELVSIRPNFDFFETRLAYDKNGVLEFMYNYGKQSQPSNNSSGAGIDRIYYDHYGNFQRWQVFSKDGEPVAGNIPKVHIGEHLYDQYGNKVGLRGFDVDGKQMAFSWGDFINVYNYDSFGNQISNKGYDQYGKLNVASRTKYSANGIFRESFAITNDDGQPISSPHLNGAAVLKFEYQQNSKKISKRIALNESLEPISE